MMSIVIFIISIVCRSPADAFLVSSPLTISHQSPLNHRHALYQSPSPHRQQQRHGTLSASQPLSSSSRPIDGDTGWPHKFPAKEHCSRCGLCETTFVANVTDACAFLPRLGMGGPRGSSLEAVVHGRSRRLPDYDDNNDDDGNELESRFGVMQQPMRLARGVGMVEAQWTGVVTSIAVAMLEAKKVDAVVCIAAASGGAGAEETHGSSESLWSSPQPILAKSVAEVMRGRGVKPALAPSLKVLDEIKSDASIRRLLFCGVGCAVQAFRVIQDDLDLEDVYVLGTNCVDNSPTPQAAETFLRDGVNVQGSVKGYEFMQDYRVHVKTSDGYVTKPYFSLPGTIAEQSIAKSCLACFDYTNGLADVVVGYMGAPLVEGQRMDQSDQTLTVRNHRGCTMIETAISAGRLQLGAIAEGSGKHETFATTTVQSDAHVQAILGEDVKEHGLPVWIGEIFAFALRSIGPKGINFAKYSIDYHILRNYFYVLNQGRTSVDEARMALPEYARRIVEHYISTNESMLQMESKIATKNGGVVR